MEGVNDRVVFLPPPYGGQSGSAIFNADGTQIVALLNLREIENGKSVRGQAVNIKEIYDAIYGVLESSIEPVSYWTRQRGWPYAKQDSQCGPRGCPGGGRESEPAPIEEDEGGDLIPDVPFALPVPVPIVGPDPVPPISEVLGAVAELPLPLPEVVTEPTDLEGAAPCAGPACCEEVATEPERPFSDILFKIAIGLMLGWIVFLVVTRSTRRNK
jgi:hypothetical protein